MRNLTIGLAVAAAAVTSPIDAQPAFFDGWNLGYTVPAGWQITQRSPRLHVLVPPTGAQSATVFVAPGPYRTFDEVAVDLNRSFTGLGLAGMPTGQPTSATVRGMQAMAANYRVQAQTGLMLEARVFAVLTPHATGFVVFGVWQPASAEQVAATVDQVAQSLGVEGPPIPNQQAIAALRGRWMFYAGRADGGGRVTGGVSHGHEEFWEFDGQGRFAYQSSSSVSVTTPGYTGAAGGAQSSNDQGSYSVIGSTLVLTGSRGRATLELQIMSDRFQADGRTYLRTN